MKKIVLFLLCQLVSTSLFAQTQQGVVKTRGRMVNGVWQPGKGLAGATVNLAGRQAVVSKGTGGNFAFPVSGQKFRIVKVQKQGYQLVDDGACTEYKYSENPLRLVMETPEQQQADLLAAERKIRRNLQRQLLQKEDEIEALQASRQEKDSLLRILYQQQGDNEKLIADMAKCFSTLDYDQLDEFYRQVSWFIENGELTRADSMLRTRGDINAQVQHIIHQGQAIQEQKEQIQKAEAVHQADIEEAARRCYSYYETFLAQHQNDSAGYYIELRTQLDTTNLEWLHDAGTFVISYSPDYEKALSFFSKALFHAIQKEGERSETVVKCYHDIASVYMRKRSHTKTMEYLNKALEIGESLFGTNHELNCRTYQLIGGATFIFGGYVDARRYFETALNILQSVASYDSISIISIYDNIGATYYKEKKYEKALEYYEKAHDMGKAFYGEYHKNMAGLYGNMAALYDDMGDSEKALSYYNLALNINQRIRGEEHFSTAGVYRNIGVLYFKKEDYLRAKEYMEKSVNIMQRFYGKKHLECAWDYRMIGVVYMKTKEYEKALQTFQLAVDIYKENYGSLHYIYTNGLQKAIEETKVLQQQENRMSSPSNM